MEYGESCPRTVQLCSIKCRDSFNIAKFTASVSAIIVGNVDKRQERLYSVEEGLAMAEKYGCPYFELDMSNGNGVLECLHGMVENALPAINAEGQVYKPTVNSIENKKKCVIS
jgi:hypothetical protein